MTALFMLCITTSSISNLCFKKIYTRAITIDVIVIYLNITNLATIPYTKLCKKQLVAQAKP